MGRKAEPGITYYRTNCDHVRNKKIKLLFNEFGSDGYWVWQCLVSAAYEQKGYYFDCNDKDELELFASDVCKKRVSLVNEVIAGCVRRGLFEKSVHDEFGVLTSQMMQDVYLDATKERRRKGTETEMVREFVLTEISDENGKITVVPWKKEIVPRNNGKNTQRNPQSKVEYSKVEKRRVEEAPARDTLPGSEIKNPDPQKKPEKQKEKSCAEKEKGSPPPETAPMSEEEKSFYDWMGGNYPNVQKLKHPLTHGQAAKLKTEWPMDDITDVLEAMENRKGLTKDYLSAEKTIRNWLKIRKYGKTNKTGAKLRPTGSGVPSGIQDYGNP